MTYKLTISEKPGYLHVVVTGRNTRENVMRYLDEILDECACRNCFRVLIEERLEGPRLGTLDVYGIASRKRTHGLSFKALAYVDVNAEGDLMKFGETVAVNRGLPVSVFSTVVDAEEWLLLEGHGGAEPRTEGDAGKAGG